MFELATLQLFFLAFADDAVLIADSATNLQIILNGFVQFCKESDLVINCKKTKVM